MNIGRSTIHRAIVMLVPAVFLGLCMVPLARATSGAWNNVGLEYPYTYSTCTSHSIVDPINVYWFGGEPTPKKVTSVLARSEEWNENDTTNPLSAIKIDHQDVWRTEGSCQVDLSQPATGVPVAYHRLHIRLFPTYKANPQGGYLKYVVGDAHEDQAVLCGEFPFVKHRAENYDKARASIGHAWFQATEEGNVEAEEEWGNNDHITQCDGTKPKSNGMVLKIDYGGKAGKIASTAPEVLSLPEITGTPAVGLPLTAHPGEWEPAQGSFIYEWGTGEPETESWTVLQEGSSSTWTPTAGYVGKEIAVRVRPSSRPSSEAIPSAPVVIEGKAPTATTGSASGVQAESATVEGTVNPNGSEAGYYFEYGPTTSYGSVAPALPGIDVGNGTSSVPVSMQLTELQPETTYHYRLVASTVVGTTYGADKTLTTTAAHHTIASVRDEKTGRRWVFYRGPEGALWEWSQASNSPSSWVHTKVTGAGEVAAGSGLATMQERESIFVTYTNSDGALEQLVSNNDGASWSLSANFGTGASSGSEIANVREPSNGGSHSEDMWVYYVSSEALWQERFEGGKWINSQITSNVVASNSGLAVMHERESIFVTYTNEDGALEQMISNNDGVSWSLSANFGIGSLGSSIANVREPSNGGSHSEDMWVYYVSSNGLWQERFEGGKWISSQVTNEVAANSGLTVMHERESIFVTYTNTNGDLEQVVSDNDGASWNLSANFGVGTAPGSAIASLREPSEVGNPASEDMWVFYYGSNGSVWQEKWAGGSWANSEVGEAERAVTGKDNIAWVRDEVTGKQWGYYVGGNNALWQWRYTGGQWIDSQVTNGVASNSSVAVMRERETILVTYVAFDGALEQVVSNNNGVSWSLSANFGTGVSPGSSIANVREPHNSGSHSEDMWVYYVSSNELCEWRWEGGKWINSQVAGNVASNSGLSVMHERESIFVTYTNEDGALEQVISGNDGVTWSLSANFGIGSLGSTIANVREPSNGGSHSEDMWVYYVSSNALWQERFEGGKWVNSQITSNVVAANSGLAVMHERESLFVTYTNEDGALEQMISNNDGVSWNLSANFGTGSLGSSIANVREPSSTGDPNSENMWIYYVTSGTIGQWKFTTKWSNANLGTLFEAHEETSTVTTEGASGIGGSGATVEGSLSPGGEVTHYQFEYGTTTAYGSSAPVPGKEVAEGVHTVKISQVIGGLAPNTTYHYRLVSTNGSGIHYGSDRTFVTTQWTLHAPAVPAGAKSSLLEGVSCTASAACTGVGHYISSAGVTLALAERWNGSEWAIQSTPMPTGGSESLLYGVSCSSSTACTSTGWYKNSSGVWVSLAESWNGTEWAVQSTPNPSGTKGVYLQGVSCPSSSGCEAVGDYVNSSNVEVLLAERWNGTEWSIQTTPSPSGAKEATLGGISCTSTTACTAVGYYKNSSSVWVTFAERWNGTEWSLQTTPNPGGAKESYLRGVSCSSATACTAVGWYQNGAGGAVTLAEYWNGSTWSIQTTGNPSGASHSELATVSCFSPTACTATGGYYTSSGKWNTLAEYWNGNEWQIEPTVVPGGTTESYLYQASCTASTICNAVGFSTNSAGTQQPLAEEGVLPWSIHAPVNPSGAKSSVLVGVSCSASAACTGVGHYVNSSGVGLALAERWNGTEWSVQSVPMPSGGTESHLNGVSCPSATACTSTGWYKNSAGAWVSFAERWNAAEWLVQSVPNPSGAKEERLSRVSCTSSSSCTAAGDYLNSSGVWVTLAEHWNGTEWSIQTTPSPSGAKESILYDVSCSSATACTAVGYYKNSSSVWVTFAERWNGTEWSLQTTPNPDGAKESYFLGVSCSSSTACIATGWYTNSSGVSVILAERWNGSEWSIQPAPNPAGASLSELNHISCTTVSTTTCTATGGYHNSSGVWTALAEYWNGSEWAIQSTSVPAGAKESFLYDLSCTSSTACTAAGYYHNSEGTELPFAEEGM